MILVKQKRNRIYEGNTSNREYRAVTMSPNVTTRTNSDTTLHLINYLDILKSVQHISARFDPLFRASWLANVSTLASTHNKAVHVEQSDSDEERRTLLSVIYIRVAQSLHQKT